RERHDAHRSQAHRQGGRAHRRGRAEEGLRGRGGRLALALLGAVMKLASAIVPALSLALVLGARTLHAEPADPRPSDGVVLPWRSIAFSDDASAIQVNPANIVRMPGPEGRLTV